MSRIFGAATSDRIDCGSPALFDNLQTFTYLGWAFGTTLTAGRVLMGKYRGATQEGWQISMNGTAQLQVFYERATTDLNYITNSTPMVVSTWVFIGATCDVGAAPAVTLASGQLNTPCGAHTFGTAVNGSGATNTDAARSLFIGNIDAASPGLAFRGNLAHSALFSSILSLAQIEQFRTCTDYKVLAAALGLTLLGYWPTPESESATALDQSGNGNNGTITGATVGVDPPLVVLRRNRRRLSTHDGRAA